MYSVLVFLLFLVLALLAHGVFALEPNYYWRDYTGTIPRDALVGAVNGIRSVYIGQVALKEAGLVVVEIHPGEKQVYIPYFGVKKSRLGIKILCTLDKETFSWEGTNSTNFSSDTREKQLVIGGLEDPSVLNVGRAEFEGDMRIGKVGPFLPEKHAMYIVDGDDEHLIEKFEVLTYEEVVEL